MPAGDVAVRPSRALRIWEATAGLTSGGLVVIGVVLVVLQLVARHLAPGTGLVVATGPGWGRVAAQLLVGVVGEVALRARRRAPVAVRWAAAVVVVVAGAGALYACWWA